MTTALSEQQVIVWPDVRPGNVVHTDRRGKKHVFVLHNGGEKMEKFDYGLFSSVTC